MAFNLKAESGFVKKEINLTNQSFKYQVYIPDSWQSGQKWPVILFLHGAGERGEDGIEQTEIGLGPVIKQNGKEFPAIVLFPQCRRGVWWNDPTMERMVMEILTRSIEEYSGDPDRVYLTGLSMGGYGTFYFGSKYPEKFAALAPVCGGVLLPRDSRNFKMEDSLNSPYTDVASKIGSKPIWIFHGDADPVVPVDESRRMKKAFDVIGVDVRYSEYPGVGHNSWDLAYAEADFAEWILSEKLR